MKCLNLSIFALFLMLAGCGKQPDVPKIPGVVGPSFNILNGKVIITLELINLNIDTGMALPIPKLSRSDIALSPRLEGGSLIQLTFDPKDVEGDEFKVVEPTTLPGGRPFPFSAGGTLPAMAINTPNLLDTTFYASQKLFGFFIPFNHPIDVDVAKRIRMNGKPLGIIALLRQDEAANNSGFMLIFTLKEVTENPDFKRLLKLSRRYPKRMF